MPDNLPTSPPIRTRKAPRTSVRRNGQRFKSAAERQQAKDTFIKAFAQSGSILASCRAAGVDRSTVDDWLEKDVPFTVRYHQAEKDAIEILNIEARRRAVHGVEDYVVSMGKLVRGDDGKPLLVKKYSDTVLLALLKAHDPKFQDTTRKLEISGPGGGPIQSAQTVALDVRGMTTEQLQALRQVLAAKES